MDPFVVNAAVTWDRLKTTGFLLQLMPLRFARRRKPAVIRTMANQGISSMPKLNRRIFLRGLGGAVVAAPFLGSVFERAVKAAPSAAAKRTIIMFTHYGCITNSWFPAKLDGD